VTFHLPASYYEPPADCCDNPQCEGDECLERAARAREDFLIEQADTERKERL